jgi:phosphoribosylglycinamide formyltransferase 2
MILLLGSGELGKEFVIALKRLGQRVIAVDSYPDAPAMQVADGFEVIDMLDGAQLDSVVAKHAPDIIVPEIEAIATERLFAYEKQGIHVVPSANAANATMNRKAIRELASKHLKLRTAKYAYASSLEEFRVAVAKIGLPCVVKPLMSSSGKGQSYVKTADDIDKAWDIALTKGRAKIPEVIVEQFIHFEREITLLTVTQKSGITLFCPAIGHRQERGDYQESWQPVFLTEEQGEEAERMAAAVTGALGGAGIWGCEFFITSKGVYFSEVSPRPHDTGMVTLANTQNLSEFELHARAVLGLPIPSITLEHAGASAVILADSHDDSTDPPVYEGLEKAVNTPRVDIRIFGKPATRPYRRMGVALAFDSPTTSTDILRARAREAAAKVKVNP